MLNWQARFQGFTTRFGGEGIRVIACVIPRLWMIIRSLLIVIHSQVLDIFSPICPIFFLCFFLRLLFCAQSKPNKIPKSTTQLRIMHSMNPLTTPISSSSPSSSSQWEPLRRQARSLENEIENKLVNYARLGSGGNLANNYALAEAAELEIEDLLKRVGSYL